MSGIQPVAVYALRIPPGDIMVPAVPDFAAMFRVTMAAIDPSAEPELEDGDDKRPARATLKVVRVAGDFSDESDSDDYEDYDDEEDDDEEESGDELSAGPSTKKSKTQKLLEALAAEADNDEDEEMDDDEDDDSIAIAALKKAMAKGKGKAFDGEDEDSEDDEDDESLEMDEVVLCTLDPEKNYQQPLDFVVAEGEKVFFKVSGTHTIHLTGNYVMPIDDGRASLYDDEEDEEDDEELEEYDDGEDYDLSPDEEELELMVENEDSDDLDDLADPRVTEVDSEEEKKAKVSKAAKASGKGKNKRPAEDSEEDSAIAANLDDLMAQSLKKEATVTAANGDEKKLTKTEKKKQKKLKNNAGEASAAPAGTPEAKKETLTNGSAADSDKKKVQFAKNLEQGPTPSGTAAAAAAPAGKANASEKKASTTASLGVRTVQGVTLDDRKAGSGPGAKKGSKLDLRYIGKLENGKVFDSNKSGKPFSLKLGAGDVIKGWDIGLMGITAGGERRLTIPPSLAYGSKSLPGIPANSKLIFDVKCLAVK